MISNLTNDKRIAHYLTRNTFTLLRYNPKGGTQMLGLQQNFEKKLMLLFYGQFKRLCSFQNSKFDAVYDLYSKQ